MTHEHAWELAPSRDHWGVNPVALYRCRFCGEIGYPIYEKAAR